MVRKVILVVEDDVDTREALRDILQIEGYEVVTAEDGAEGIQTLRSLAQLPCVILLDLMMPGTSGWQFLEMQRNDPKLNDIPVAVCSAYEESAIALTPCAFISKPIRLDALLGTVNSICA